MKTTDLQKKMMGRAISLAKEGAESDNGGPFGAVITKGEEIIAATYNRVSGDQDCTQHAELRAIQLACKQLGTKNLEGCVLYTSCEPCMMCLGAAHWANFDYIYYAASAEDAKENGFLYSDMYYNSSTENRHQEFKMIQLCRDEALKVWLKK
ncbi:nucleoside deaminase [Christiangramia marina]|uniref:nucleoside deaminase n=1 Tax=Christiangramia marina TaxID=409436 RepID=UPI003AA7F650